VVKRTFGTALQLMNEYPDYTYTQSAAQYNSWIADKYPQMNDEIKQRIKEGRWEIVGGMWVEPDLNMPDGEAQVRSILVGKRWFQKEYGVDVGSAGIPILSATHGSSRRFTSGPASTTSSRRR
jgi:alpha-mannosidase